MENYIKEIIEFGKKVVDEKLCSSFFGNISIRKGKRIFISKTGSMLDYLDENEIVECNLEDEFCEKASSEYVVHREIYLKSSKVKAILHTHSLYTVLYQKVFGKFLLDNFEFSDLLGNIKIVEGKSGSKDLAVAIGNCVKETEVVVVRNHGVFSWGESLKSCYVKISMLEYFCKMSCMEKMLRR